MRLSVPGKPFRLIEKREQPMSSGLNAFDLSKEVVAVSIIGRHFGSAIAEAAGIGDQVADDAAETHSRIHGGESTSNRALRRLSALRIFSVTLIK